MKKILAFIFTICLMASVFCVMSVAADATSNSSDDVILIRGLKGEELVRLDSFKSFEEGWSKAVEYACDENYMREYERIVVDILADWESENGMFTDEAWYENDPGFKWDTIYIGSRARMTINMNGHTINRKLTTDIANGEVMYIDSGADVIINGGQMGDPIVKLGENPGEIKLGTITGGHSWNGAGGIHINNNADVVINNVILKGNSVTSDDGMAIAVYGGAKLTMNGGKIIDNNGHSNVYGAIYVQSADATFNGVLISGNNLITGYTGTDVIGLGAAACVNRGTVSFKNCTIANNHCDRYGGAIGVLAGEAVLNECIVTGNTSKQEGSAIAIMGYGSCTITNSKITGNKAAKGGSSFYAFSGTIRITNSEYDNKFKTVTSGKIVVSGLEEDSKRSASIFGEGSVAMIIACAALISSITCIVVVIFNNKKTSKPQVENTEE